ncbi:LytR/AlgR family response regulator transcription factor [Aquimarina algicola]|uniref:Response regulator transcription factor n=1 Tax=Aquimarina algicola TaxID=2589995 RepID=A0A504JMF9_9FLAO|nr:LytTR family DNA-binding domain-containing protein [Aquimarina algicola]TPN88958.1 response regulator transcription factor [Aquimarina algicola]
MKYTCLIVDDEELARDLIKNHLDQLDHFELVGMCESAIEASQILKNQKIDLLFLDIEMPVLRGTDFFRNIINKPNVIFTTAYRDYAVDGFELNAIDYLLKPITFSRFFKAIEKFLELQSSKSINHLIDIKEDQKRDYIFVRKERKQVKIFFDEILCVESVRDYIKIKTESGNHLVKYSLTAFIENLDNNFIRTHRSYVVNIKKITAYTKNDVEIGKIEIPIGERYKSIIKKVLS